MTTFALDDDWVEIDFDTYEYDEDEFGTALIGKVKAEIPEGPFDTVQRVRYYGLFSSEYDESYDDEESEEVLETDE